MSDSPGIPRLVFPPPDPLREIADRLAPLVRKHPGYFTDAVVRWAANPPRHGKNGEDGILPIPLPVNSSRDEQIALLAAIYDSYVRGDAQIAPWRDLPDDPDPSEERLAIRYGVLLSRLPALVEHWDAHKLAVKMFLDEAERDLADAGQRDEGKAQKPKRRGRKKPDYETVQREAKLAAEWEQARDAKIYKPVFAKDNSMTVEQLDDLLDRVFKRKKRKNRSE